MKQFLKIVAWGLVIWGLSLAWPAVSELLTSRVADALVVGLVVAAAVFYLGRNFNRAVVEEQRERDQADRQNAVTRPTRPSSRVTRPIPELAKPGLHSLATRPVPVTQGQGRHTRITRPMPIGR
jgi:hypothetical protein